MKPVAASRWLLIAIPTLAVAFGLAGCAPPRYIPPPLPRGPIAPAVPPQVSRPVFYVKVNHLNLRACPGMDCPKISLLERNEEVEKVGAAEDWFQIRVKRDGRLGWVDSRYLSPTPVAAPEAAPPPPPVQVLPPPPIEEVPPPLPPPQRPAPPPVEKVKPVKPEEAAPPAKQKPEEAKPAKPAKAKPEETGGGAPKVEKPAPKEEKPAPPPEETPAPAQKIRIM
ncbi:MAG: SH3 domain-containing protein [Desulfobaccales bacterium]